MVFVNPFVTNSYRKMMMVIMTIQRSWQLCCVKYLSFEAIILIDVEIIHIIYYFSN